MTKLNPSAFVLFLSFLAFAEAACGQTDTLLHRIHFTTDRHQLTAEHRQSLHEFAASLSQEDGQHFFLIEKILVSAHTDSDADSLYNVALSQRRAAAVEVFLREKLPGVPIESSWFGEGSPVRPNTSELNKRENRRAEVEVVISQKKRPELEIVKPDLLLKIPAVKPAVPLEMPPTEPIDTCTQDTTVTLPQGTVLTLNRCDFLQMQDCLTAGEFLSPEAMRRSGLTTMTASGEMLESCGMICIDFCGAEKLRKPIAILFPVSPCLAERRVGLWKGDSGGRWGDERKGAIRIVERDGQRYYRFEADKPNCYNCDLKRKSVRWKFKAQDGLRLLAANVSFDCPGGVYGDFSQRAMGKRKLKFRSRCYSDGALVKLRLLRPDGEVVELDYQPLENLAHFRLRKRCPQERWLGIIPLRRKDYRRVNFVGLEDLGQLRPEGYSQE